MSIFMIGVVFGLGLTILAVIPSAIIKKWSERYFDNYRKIQILSGIWGAIEGAIAVAMVYFIGWSALWGWIVTRGILGIAIWAYQWKDVIKEIKRA